MSKLPKPSMSILKVMATNTEPMTPGQIQKALSNFSVKDIKYALRRLREKRIIKQIPNLLDMRRVYYRLITQDEIRDVVALLSEDEVQIFTPLFTGQISPS